MEGQNDEDVALTHWEGLKFLAGTNHNTPFVFIHGINIMYDTNSLQGIALGRATCISIKETWPPGSGSVTCITYKFGHRVVPLALPEIVLLV